MTTVVEAQAALDNAANKKNTAESALIDALSKEKDLSAQLGRLLADSAPTADVLAVRQERDQARQNVEDLESALSHLTDDVATARQAVYQATVSEARATIREEGDALSTSVEALEAAVENVAKFKRAAIDAGLKLRAAALQGQFPVSFGVEEIVNAAIRERLFPSGSGFSTAPLPEQFAGILQSAEHFGTGGA